jgi:hypothetical protein
MVSALAFLLATASARATDAITQREDQFKAAYVFNFVKFVAWPGAADANPLLICFIGAEDVYNDLASGIEDKRAGSRRLAALLLADTASADSCSVLYIDASMASDYTPANEPAMLTISDGHDFVARGGMIELFTENHRLRFLINLQSAQQAGLRISSDLLKLAAGVQRGRQ